jgi:hypothetical protein
MDVRVALILLVFAGLTSCANKVAPEGGPRDSQPPRLLRSAPENFSTSFGGREIILVFDEYIQLAEAGRQVIISPLPEQMPEFILRKKMLQVIFKTPLLPHTTYTLNFGNAIADLKEGNRLDDFRFVFSTGAHLDSLFIHGTVSDAYTHQPATGVLVMLYLEILDSLPFLARPYFITRTDATGYFQFNNLGTGPFKLFALKETNNNYLYDQPGEMIAWMEPPVSGLDTTRHQLWLTRETPDKIRLQNVIVAEPVRIHMAFNKRSDIVLKDKKSVPSWHQWYFNKSGDSLTLWMADTLMDSLQVYLYEQDQVFDSVFISLRKAMAKQPGGILQPFGIAITPHEPRAPICFSVSHPVARWNADRIQILTGNDTLRINQLKWMQPLFCCTDVKIISEKPHQLYLMPGALTDIYGRTSDTIKATIPQLNEKETGTLMVQLQNKSSCPLIIHLVNEKEMVIRDTVVTGTSPSIFMQYLLPGTYRLKAIEDCNANVQWDSGHYLQKVRPERVAYFSESITVRPNWDIENSWKIEFR